MLVQVIDGDKLEKRHAYWGFPSKTATLFTVLAICKQRNRGKYLIEYEERLHWWDSDLFNTINASYPDKWIEKKYRRFHKLKNKNYDFDLAISYYCGPEEFLENPDFLFDLYENPREAYQFYQKVIASTEM